MEGPHKCLSSFQGLDCSLVFRTLSIRILQDAVGSPGILRSSWSCTLLLFSCQVLSDSFSTPWTVAYQALLSMEFSRQEDCNGLPFPTPGDLPNLGIKPMSPALAGGFFTTRSTWENISSVQFRLSVVSGSLRPHRLQYITFPCPSPTPRFYSNSCRLSR